MRFAFIVQGEGRGHLTQALSLAEIIKERGHEIAIAFVGSKKGDFVQNFFQEQFPAQVVPFASPALVFSKKTKALSLPKTICGVIVNFGAYTKSLQLIHRELQDIKPDVIINFYDTLAGIHQILFPKKASMFCIAHQYMMLHKSFAHPKGNWLNRSLVNFNTRITALGSKKKLALSFYDGEADGNIVLMPPLLRKDVKGLKSINSNFLLAYVNQAALAEEIIKWQQGNKEVEVHCFSDKSQTLEVEEVSPNLYFHKINGGKFLEMMSRCRGLIATAGFESICEAVFLGKPTLMVPMKNHYEQLCNALDASNSGAGIFNENFSIDEFMSYIPQHSSKSKEFQDWQSQSGDIFFEEISPLVTTNYTRYRFSPAFFQKYLQTR